MRPRGGSPGFTTFTDYLRQEFPMFKSKIVRFALCACLSLPIGYAMLQPTEAQAGWFYRHHRHVYYPAPIVTVAPVAPVVTVTPPVTTVVPAAPVAPVVNITPGVTVTPVYRYYGGYRWYWNGHRWIR
jgi:hypothetical protein